MSAELVARLLARDLADAIADAVRLCDGGDPMDALEAVMRIQDLLIDVGVLEPWQRVR